MPDVNPYCFFDLLPLSFSIAVMQYIFFRPLLFTPTVTLILLKYGSNRFVDISIFNYSIIQFVYKSAHFVYAGAKFVKNTVLRLFGVVFLLYLCPKILDR